MTFGVKDKGQLCNLPFVFIKRLTKLNLHIRKKVKIPFWSLHFGSQLIWSLYFGNSQFSLYYFELTINFIFTVNLLMKNVYMTNDVNNFKLSTSVINLSI